MHQLAISIATALSKEFHNRALVYQSKISFQNYLVDLISPQASLPLVGQSDAWGEACKTDLTRLYKEYGCTNDLTLDWNRVYRRIVIRLARFVYDHAGSYRNKDYLSEMTIIVNSTLRELCQPTEICRQWLLPRPAYVSEK